MITPKYKQKNKDSQKRVFIFLLGYLA